MDTLLGSLLLVPYNFVPHGFLACNGQLLQIMQYQALFALLGTQFGGDGKTTFGLPNLTGDKAVTDANGVKLTWVICSEGVFPSTD